MKRNKIDEKKKKKKKKIPLEDVSVVSRLSNIIYFRDAASPIGNCRRRTLNSLTSLLDSTSLDRDDIDTPMNALGPIIDAVVDWIVEPSNRDDKIYQNYRKNCIIQRKKEREKNRDHKNDKDVDNENFGHNDNRQNKRRDKEEEKLKKKENESDNFKQNEKEKLMKKKKEEKKERDNMTNILQNIPSRSSKEEEMAQGQGLVGVLLGAAYTAGINFLTGNFSALSSIEVQI